MPQLRWVESQQDLSACYDIRREVFVQEQAVPEELELDDYDAVARHALVVANDGQPAGTARLLVDTPQPGQSKIGRVAVRAPHRGQGLAVLLMRALEAEAASRGQSSIVLDAQVAVIPFYEKLGYQAYGPVFDDAGIDHRKMSKSL
jgi:predicted GNAT family N-acyltransferase